MFRIRFGLRMGCYNRNKIRVAVGFRGEDCKLRKFEGLKNEGRGNERGEEGRHDYCREKSG